MAEHNTQILFDRSVLDNIRYSLQRGFPLPTYLTADVVAQAASRIDHVLVLNQVASAEVLEERNRATGRMTNPKTIEQMSATLERVYTQLGCHTQRLPAGTPGVDGQRVKMAFSQCGLG